VRFRRLGHRLLWLGRLLAILLAVLLVLSILAVVLGHAARG
jgi:hypothetical protein